MQPMRLYDKISLVLGIIGVAGIIIGFALPMKYHDLPGEVVDLMVWGSVAVILASIFLTVATHLPFPARIKRTTNVCAFSVSIFAIICTGLWVWFRPIAPALLGLSADVLAPSFSPGQTPAGISWKDEYKALDIVITNNTDDDYQNLNLFVQPDAPVAAAAQKSAIPGVFVQMPQTPHASFTDYNPVTHEIRAIPTEIVATTIGYNVRSAVLPSHSTIEVLMATVLIRPGADQMPSLGNNTLDISNYAVRFGVGNSSVWQGVVGGNYLLAGAHPDNVSVKGSYTADGRKRPIATTLHVVGYIDPEEIIFKSKRGANTAPH